MKTVIVSLCFMMVLALSAFSQEHDSLHLEDELPSKSFKLAMIQMHVIGGEKQENMNHAIDLIAEAAGEGAEVALLPECMDLGWTNPSSHLEAEPIPLGIPCTMLMQAAKANAIFVIAGLTEKSENKVYNTAVIINPKGEIIGKHRKLNEVLIGHEYYAQGDQLSVSETKLGSFGTMICSDGFADGQVLSRSLCYMGADIILSPCAWAVNANHDNDADPYGGFWRSVYVPVARDFSVPIIGVSNVGWMEGGPWDGHKCIGSSLAIGPDGKDMIQAPYGVDAECILYVDIILTQRPTRGNGWQHYLKQKEQQ